MSTTLLIKSAISRANAGDRSAVTEIVINAQRRLERLARKMMRGERRSPMHGTCDLVQNASIRLLRRLERHTPESPCDFFRMASREMRLELIDLARRFSKERALCKDIAPSDEPCDDSRPDNLQAWSDFHEVVATLPEEERTAFELVFYHELPQTEAAELMGQSIWTYRRILGAAKKKLARALSEALCGATNATAC